MLLAAIGYVLLATSGAGRGTVSPAAIASEEGGPAAECCDHPTTFPSGTGTPDAADCCSDECPQPCCGGIPVVADIILPELMPPVEECTAPWSSPDRPRAADSHEIYHPPQT